MLVRSSLALMPLLLLDRRSIIYSKTRRQLWGDTSSGGRSPRLPGDGHISRSIVVVPMHLCVCRRIAVVPMHLCVCCRIVLVPMHLCVRRTEAWRQLGARQLAQACDNNRSGLQGHGSQTIVQSAARPADTRAYSLNRGSRRCRSSWPIRKSRHTPRMHFELFYKGQRPCLLMLL